MCIDQMHRDARLQMREELHCRWCTAVGWSRFAAVMCGNLACAHAPNFCVRTHFPRFLVRVSGKRSCHAKVHNNRGATVISCSAVTTNCKSSAEAVEFSLTIALRVNFPPNFVHLDDLLSSNSSAGADGFRRYHAKIKIGYSFSKIWISQR